MEQANIVTSFKSAIMTPGCGIDVTELYSTNPSISALRSVRSNDKPHVFNFRVPVGAISAAVRLSGTSILTSHSARATILIQPGTTYLLSAGSYSVIFGKSSSETIFLLADRAALPEIEPFLAANRSRVPHTTIELGRDPILQKVESIKNCPQREPFFRLSSLLMDILERIGSAASEARTLYRLPQLDSAFDKLCHDVIASPRDPWSVPEAAAKCGYSVYHFSRTFKAKTGQGFHEFVNRVRSIQAVLLICEQGKLPEEAFESVGIGPGTSASKVLLKELGLTVADIKKVLALTEAIR
ncbi:MAG: AraC family transcriptional regulator [Armatimonadota bacterium]